MSKETYKFSEVLFGLREEYLKNSKMLEELENYIHISGDKYDDCQFSLDNSLRGHNVIRLDIMKKQSDLSKLLDYISYTVFSRSPYEEPFQIVKNGEDGLYFGVDYYTDFNPTTHYKVEITDNNQFKELTDEIYNSRLFKQKPKNIHINPFQKLSIDLYKTSLSTDGEIINSRSFGIISYDSFSDTIHARPNMRKGYHYTLDMLATEIPAYMIPEGYREIIDDNLKQYNIPENVRLDSRIDKREELYINKKDKEMVLTKRRKLKFYE